MGDLKLKGKLGSQAPLLANFINNKMAGRVEKMAEVGVLYGRTSQYLLARLPGIHMTLVDQWAAIPAAPEIPGHIPRTQEQMDEAFAQVQEMASKFEGRVRICRAPSITAANRMEDRAFDLVFLDADHTVDGVVADIRAWRRKVRKGGWLVGDDFTKPTVRQAVNAQLGSDYGNGGRLWWHQVK